MFRRLMFALISCALTCTALEAAPPWKRAYRAQRDMMRAQLELQQANCNAPNAVYQQQKRILRQNEKILLQEYRLGRAAYGPSSPGHPRPVIVVSPNGMYRTVTTVSTRSNAAVSKPTRTLGQPTIRQTQQANVFTNRQRTTVPSVTQATPARRVTGYSVTAVRPLSDSGSTVITEERVTNPAPMLRIQPPTVVSSKSVQGAEELPELVPTPMAQQSPAELASSADGEPQPTPARRQQSTEQE